MQKSLLVASVSLAALALSSSQPLLAQSSVDQQLGNVSFQTSCNEVAQRRFNRAMRYQHSFWYRQSQGIFEEALKADPECAIALWGVALSLLSNPHAPAPTPNLALGLAAIQKAKAVGAKSQRERDYIDALTLMYVDYDKLNHRQRIGAYLKAMEALAAKYPDDDEAQIAYAITLNTSASPADKSYAQQTKGAAILEPISKRLPQHPGVTHYLIHLYDYPSTAAKGLDAANRYAKVAPTAPHAQHMPSHIYTRVGYWKESIDSNVASVRAAKADKEVSDQLHGQDYLVYAYLQLAQDKKARAVVDEMAAVIGYNPNVRGAIFALAASPARYMVERGDWKGAAELQVRPSPAPFVDAITHFARALGAARSGNPDAAKADIAKLAELRDNLRATKDAYWSEQVDIQWQVATAWVLHAEGKHAEALKAISTAAYAEDNTEKSPVTPRPLAPARELYGFMLLERGMAKEALAAFEATKMKEPNRFLGYVGAAQAADMLGDRIKAKENYQKPIALAATADSERPEIFSQGMPADAVFYIQKGRVKIVVTSEQGKEAVIAILGVGYFFGEGCLIGQALRLATVTAMTETQVMRVDKPEMTRLLRAEPAIAEVFMAHLLTRNSRIEEDLIDQLFNSSEKRLARTLLLLANFGKDGKPEEVIVKISQETLADMVGTTRSRVNYFMNKFRKLGFIKYNGDLEVHSSLLNVVLRD